MKSKEILFRLLLLIFFFSLSPSCGKKGSLRMPEFVVPQAIKDLKAKGEGKAILLNFSIPNKNTNGSPLTNLRGLKVLRSMRKLSEGCEGCPRKFVPLTDIEFNAPSGQAPLPGETREFRDTALPYAAAEYEYKVLSFNDREEFSRESNVAVAFWDIPPSPPQSLTAEAGNETATLRWRPVKTLTDGAPSRESIQYNFYRSDDGKQFPFEPVNEKPVATTSFQDTGLANDQKYFYRVHAARTLSTGWVESEPSTVVSATPEKLFPPSIPQGLTAFWTDEGISLRWEGSPEPDVLGYNLYRREEGETKLRRLNREPIKSTIFLDQEASRDKEYYYAISAVDSSPRRNESRLSEEVKVVYYP